VLQVLRGPERTGARGEAEDEVDRSGRRHAGRIRNAIRRAAQKVDIPASKLKTEIARILKKKLYCHFKPSEERGTRFCGFDLKYGNNNER